MTRSNEQKRRLYSSSALNSNQRIAVIGAGITGITTAYELAADGHQVTLYDRRDAVAVEGSFANAGLLSPGSVSPAAAPGLRPWLLRGLLSHDAALRWRPAGLSLAQWRWLRQWWRACGRGHADDVRAMVALARHSQERLDQLSQRLQLEFERSSGVLLLLRHEREFKPAHRHVQMLTELGVLAQPLDPVGCRAIEPGLGHKAELAGGIHLVSDGVGNCRQFAQLLRDHLVTLPNVQLRLNTRITGISRETGPIALQLSTTPGAPAPSADIATVAHHDALVVCAGATAPSLLQGLGWRLPLMPVRGHSVTFRLQVDGHAPRSAVIDAQAGVAISRQGSRIRITGGYDLGPADAPGETALRPLYDALNRWFPYAAERKQAQVWTGARPMLPEGPPIIGRAPTASGQGPVWLNLGHGAHGWTLACGSARLLADQIAGLAPAVDARPFSADRWLTA